MSHALLGTPEHKRAGVGRPAKTCIFSLCADTGQNLEDQSGLLGDRDGWRERLRFRDSIWTIS